jgi:hypothetical protein
MYFKRSLTKDRVLTSSNMTNDYSSVACATILVDIIIKHVEPNFVDVDILKKKSINKSSTTTRGTCTRIASCATCMYFSKLPLSFPRLGIVARTFDVTRALPGDD